MKQKLLLLLFALLTATMTWADVEINETTFPDEEFRSWILRQSYGQDGVLTDEEIAGVTFVNVLAQNIIAKGDIKSLKGIEYFTAMTKLQCSRNELTELDLSKNTALQILKCGGNHLTELDLSKNTELTYIEAQSNRLTSLDVSYCPKLTELACAGNQLTTLNASGCSKITKITCYLNQLTALDLSGCCSLDTLWCFDNQLSSLDVSDCISMTLLWCNNNQLTKIDVLKNTKLKQFRCHDNQLTSLNVSKNKKMTDLRTFHNQITGEAMDALVASLPIVSKSYICPVLSKDEQGVMTSTQAAAAKAKGWIPMYWDEDAMKWQEYEGSDDPATLQGQLFKPLGLGIETPREMVTDFQPQIYIEGDILYACTIQGLYFKDMSDEGSEWQLAGFEGIPVLDYVRRGDDIFALCFNGQNDIFLLSHDGGQTYEDATPDNFRYYINKEGHVFWYFNQHPTDPNTFLLSSFHAAGIFLTTDFGQTWNKLTSYTPEYMGFHPLNPEIIYECSGGGYTDEKTDIRISYDGGQTWQEKAQCFPNYHRIFRMAFHPTDPNKWIVGGGAYIYATNDYGQTWNIQRLDNYEIDWRYEAYGIDWRYAAYDDENADVVYMAGGHHGEYMKVMCSTDGGKTWNKPCQEPAKITPYEYVFDMKQYGDKLLIYSQSDVYEISKAELLEQQTTPVRNISATQNDEGKMINDKYYDLQGRKLPGKPARGIYIENGQKKVK